MSKGSSDRKINYNLRPSKSIERKMILEVLKEVCTPKEAKNYKYIGFGSSFFTDFKLFHKGLGIHDMVSIENKKSNEQRVLFNKPFSCIDLKIGFSKDILPQLNWDKKVIVWLDYESGLKDYMFEDISICARNVKKNSFLIVTLRREFDETTKEEFEEAFSENVYVGFKNEDLLPAKCATTILKMFTNKIKHILNETYAAYPTGQKLIFKQLFDLTYKDEAKMYTFGGMFIADNEEETFNSYNFNSLEFVGDKNKSYDISFPIITNKEYHILNGLLPGVKDEFINNLQIGFIPKEHRESYYNTYKFYPSYLEINDM